MTAPPRSHPAPLASVAALVLVAVLSLGARPPVQPAPARPTGPAVLLVVLDSVRADRTSLCGYDRPTTPALAALAREGTWTCEARAPGSWTLPSHASYFTGLAAARTGARFDADADTSVGEVGIRPMRGDVPTLAEHFAAEGWHTALVSGNPMVGRETGVARGYAHVRSARAFGELYGPPLVAAVRETLAGLPPEGRLFLTVNIADAHHPWSPIPAEVPWLTAGLGFSPFAGLPGPSPWQRFVTGRLSPAERASVLRVASNAYDWAIARADRTLRRVLHEVDVSGWGAAGRRVIVTSDHGEFLGEHGLLDHGRYLWEENQRVPLVYVPENGAPAPAPFPEPLNALHAFHLARDGALPAEPAPVFATSYPDAFWSAHSDGHVGGATTAAAWLGDEKLVWTDGAWRRYDLAADAAEAAPLPVEAVPGWVEAEVEHFVGAAGEPGDGAALDPELADALRALGYTE